MKRRLPNRHGFGFAALCALLLGVGLFAAPLAAQTDAPPPTEPADPAEAAQPTTDAGQTESVDGSRETVSFTAANVPSPVSMGAGPTAQRRILREFLKNHPNYRIDPFQMPTIEGASQDSGPLMGIAAGQPPHAIYVNFRMSASYINHGFLAPMEVLLARIQSDDPRVRQTDADGEWLADPSEQEIAEAKRKIKQRVADQVWPVVHREADVDKQGVPQGEHVWSLPTSTLVRALIYRKDLFREAGLNPEQPPQTWDELMEAARAIDALPGKSGIMIPGGPTISWAIYSYMVSNNVRYLGQNEQGRWEARFNTEAAAESIYYVLRLAAEQYEAADGTVKTGAAVISPNKQILSRQWSQGEIGMNTTYLAQDQLGGFNPELTGIAPIPSPPGGNPSGELNARMLGVFAGSTPEQQLAVMRYIWFITSDQAQRINVRTLVEFGFGQFVNPLLLEKFGYDDILRQVPASWRRTFETAMQHGVPEPYGQNTQFLYQKVSEPINWALNEAPSLMSFTPEEAKARIKERLDAAADRVDRFMLQNLTPEQERQRRIVGGIALALVLIGFAAAMVYVWRAFTAADVAKGVGGTRRYRNYWKAYLLMLPAFAMLMFWDYFTTFMGLPLALFDYELVVESKWVGIDNFATVLYDERFWQSLWRTFYYVLLVVGLGFWPPIMVAILLDEVPTATLKYTFRTIFYLPAIVSGVIMVFLWVQFYQPDDDGFLNQLLMSVNALGPITGTILKWVLLGTWLTLLGTVMAFGIRLREMSLTMRATTVLFGLALLGVTVWPLVEAYMGPSQIQLDAMRRQAQDAGEPFNAAAHYGMSAVWSALSGLVGKWNIEPIGWIHDPALAMVCVVIPGIWAGAGPGCIIYLAALKTVPDELVEAATIDGAGIMQKLAYITLPRIKFLILIQLIGAVVGAFKGGTNFILAMTGGGPNGATRVLGMDIFERTFMELRYGIGAAMAWLLGALVIALTAFQLKRMSRAEFKTADTTAEEANAPAK